MPVVRRKMDWVYRSNLRGLSTAPWTGTDSLGTYEFQVRSLTTGIAGATALWLVDAKNREMSGALTNSNQAQLQPSASRPEPSRTRVHMVEGIIYIEPSTWAVGNLMAMGVRICALEQDINTGLASVDPDMTMWLNAAAGMQQSAAAIYANDKQLCMYEQRAFKSFGDNGSIMVMRIRARLNWTLQAQHGLALWLEGESTSVNVRYQTWLRTLVSV